MGNFGWFMTGIGFGAFVGILYAPKAGAETRADLLVEARVSKEKGAALTKQASAKAGEYVEQSQEAAKRYLEQGKTLASDQLARASAALKAGKRAYVEGPQQVSAESTFNMGSSTPESGV